MRLLDTIKQYHKDVIIIPLAERRERARRERVRRERTRKSRTNTVNYGAKYGDLYYPSGLKVLVVDDTKHIFYTEDKILEKLNKVNFGNWVSEKWDCEDRAIWGYINVRKMLPQCPIGRADGFVEGHDTYHAVIIYWTDDKTRKYWDPNSKSVASFHPYAVMA